MMPESFPVFLNGRQLVAVPGTTVRQLLRDADPALAGLADGGAAVATDGRGVALDLDAPLSAGAILRVQKSARRTGPADDA